MSLLFNMLSRFVLAFLPRSKHLLISWLQWFWSPQIKICHCFHCFPIYLPWTDVTGGISVLQPGIRHVPSVLEGKVLTTDCQMLLLTGLHAFLLASVQFSRSVGSNFLQPHGLQLPCPSPSPGVYSNSCRSNRWCHPAISSSVVLFSSCPNPSQHQGLFQWVNSSHEVAKVLEFQLQHQSFQWTPRTDLL